MASRKQSEDPRRNLRKPQHDAMENKYQLVGEELVDRIEEEQTREDATMISIDVENKLEVVADESDGIPSDVDELDEWTCLDLQLLHTDFKCLICLGILKNAKTYNGCLHRFCEECINTYMRSKSSRKDCPSCRKFYGTNRVLRKDQNTNSIIEVVFGDISQYEIEEQEHQQLAVTIPGVPNVIGNNSTGKSAKRSYNGQENAHARKRTRKPRTRKHYKNQSDKIEQDQVIQNEHQQDQVNENETDRNEGDENKGDDEIMAEILQLRSKKLKSFYQDSSTDTDLEYGLQNTSGGVVLNTEIPSCGSAATRYHGSSSGATRIRHTRLTILAKHLRVHGQKKKKNDQFEIHVKLLSLNMNIVGNLETSNLFCSPAMPFHHLREYVTRETPIRAKDVQMFIVEEANPDPNQASSSRNHHTSLYLEDGYANIDFLLPEDSQVLAHFPNENGNLIIAYGQKNIS